MPRGVHPFSLSADERNELQRWVTALGTPQQVALRCRIVLAIADGKTEVTVAVENGLPTTCQPHIAATPFFVFP
jgi:hypothetical protein